MKSAALGTLQALAADARRFCIRHADQSPYLRRWLLWGVDALDNHDPTVPDSGFLHRIFTADGDRHMHNHPWAWSIGIILSGGYTERRLAQGKGGAPVEKSNIYIVGDANFIRHGEYHSITAVQPDTWTLFLVGREISDWGFLVDGSHVPHAEYLSRPDVNKMGHTEET